MSQWAGILGKLGRPQYPHILDTFQRCRAHVGREALIAVDGESLFQTQLEPVAASDAVSGPVVEIFMRNHTFDTVEIAVGGDLGIGENIARVENVQPFILHRTHVEIADRNDVEQAEIIFAAIGFLIPAHRVLERLHRVTGAIEIAVADPDIELDRLARTGREAVVVGDQIASDEREEIARLGPGIIPLHPVAALLAIALPDLVTVAEQYGELRLVRFHPHLIAAQHIGPVGGKGDPAETLRLALCAQHSVRAIETHQLGVGRRIQFYINLDNMRRTGQWQNQIALDQLPVAPRRAVDFHRSRGDIVALQNQRFVR